MRITIDNLDGLGAVDYSAWVSTAGPLKVDRRLNVPSTCECVLDLDIARLRRPVRGARMVVTRENATVVFTGYLTTEPERMYAGVGVTGAVYRARLRGVSDEWLLDRQGAAGSGAGLGQSGTDALAALTTRAGASGFTVSHVGTVPTLGVFEPKAGSAWSESAGELAGGVGAAYRVIGGVIGLQPVGTVKHPWSDAAGTLQPDGLQMLQAKEPAVDVTVSGEREPAMYLSETFAGDGATSVFFLSETPFRQGASSGSAALISDGFAQGSFDTRVWEVSDPGSHFSFTSAGLTLSGGNGQDGQTTLAAIDALELGGVLVLEMSSVQISGGSNGVLCGLFDGDVSRASCFAGYNVRQSGGATVLVPLVGGVEAGTVFSLQSGHVYTLRLRLRCAEVQRVRQIYYAMSGATMRSFGGGLVEAPIEVVFEVRDLGVSSNTPATVLYDGRIASSPASCSFAPVDSVQLVGSVGSCSVVRTGSVWVTKRSATGVVTTQLTGNPGEGVDCTVSSAGQVTFVPGRIPQAGEMVTVKYRSSERAVARIEDRASAAAESASGIAGASQWRGRVVSPPARSTEDCESAAEALLSMTTGATAGMSGSYAAEGLTEDIWPGDVLTVTRDGETVQVVARRVEMEDGLAVPELVTMRVTLADGWAEGLSIRISDTVASDVKIPEAARTGAGQDLASLPELTPVNVSGRTLQIDAGTAPPTGGGFEVRRRDGGFGMGTGQDLVLRSPVRSFLIPRGAQVERFFVRMYDGSTPPVYSRLSSAVFTNVPLG